ncbi:MAG: 6-bladed beta-propeller [Candidatus Krumholzibacteria bacterium]|nr:6-bladed beta-propeller [Candidatus Krumholzibacteria bacterium]
MLSLRERFFRLLSFLPLFAFLMMALTLPAFAGEEVITDGILHVVNGAEPSGGRQTMNLEELWRAGGEDDEETVFGIITKVLIDDDNNIYLLDAQLSEISVFSPEGELINTLGREGEGPGEFRGPADMCFLPDGTIGVLQTFPGKVIKLNLDNTSAGTWPLGDPTKGAFYMMRGLRQGGGNVVAGGTEQHVDQANGIITRETFLSNLTTEGLRDKTFATTSVTMKLAELRLDEKELIDGADRRFDVGDDGQVVVAIPRNGYEVSIFAADGTLKRVFSREYEPWQRDERAAGIWQRILETVQRTQLPGAPISWEDTEPDVEFIRVARDGTIWILNSRAMWTETPGAFTYYDVFSPMGHFEKQVQVICEGNPKDDILFFAGNDLAFMITGFWDAALSRFGGSGTEDDEDEAEPMSVICYRIK